MNHKLTRTEAKVARLISLGCTTRHVAAILGISIKTVENHRWRAMRKLDVHTMAALTRAALDLGITSLDARLTDPELDKLSLASRLDPPEGIAPPTPIDRTEEAKAEE